MDTSEVVFLDLSDKPEAFTECPKCGVRPFAGHLRGKVRIERFWAMSSEKAVCICSSCLDIVGYEDIRKYEIEDGESLFIALLDGKRKWQDESTVFPA